MGNLYLLVDLAILAGPLALSFDRKVAFFRHWPAVLTSIAVVSSVYLVWDAVVTEIGHWSFNPAYSGSIRIAGLPLGEILFFVTVPYACLFIYEVVRGYFKERTARSTAAGMAVGLPVAVVLAVLAFLSRDQGYTALALASTSVMIVVTLLFDRTFWRSSAVLLYFLLSYIPFLVANGVLTGMPVVQYNPAAIWGIRIISIPLEDFFYNFAMLGFYLFIYRLSDRARPGRTAQPPERS